MTLTAHALAGAAAASLFPQQPAVAFVAGFASHFAMDAIPHWDYKLLSKKETGNPLEEDMVLGKAFIMDLLRIGSDATLGVLLSVFIFSLWIFHAPLFIVVLGAVAGILPDPLQFIYMKTRSKILEPLQQFHSWIQKPSPIAVPAWVGLGLQCAVVVLIIGILKLVI